MSDKRNLAAWWLLGLCNNFAYVIMLSAAKDILEKGHDVPVADVCNETLSHRACAPISTGSVLLADIVPAIAAKLATPFFLAHIPFDIRHAAVVMLQAGSYVIVALSEQTWFALLGVALASAGSGFGEVSYLAMSAHYPATVITAWSSGTGGAGVFGALAYAVLTDSFMVGMTPKHALLTFLTVPALFAYTFWGLLKHPPTVHRVRPCSLATYTTALDITPRVVVDAVAEDTQPLLDPDRGDDKPKFNFQLLSPAEKWREITPLFRYMVPLTVVYFGEYFINQGLLELLVFDCDHGFRLPPSAQYRWFQVLYQVGVFASRTAGGLVPWLPPTIVFALLQLLNASVLTIDAVWPWILPHFAIVAVIVLYEGFLGGTAYVWTYKDMHNRISPERREFSLGFVGISDSFGISIAGFAAIPAHNAICALSL